MRRRRLLAVTVAAALLTGVAPTVAQAGDPIMPLSELRPGMRCTGYSVVRGTAISSFAVEIVDVVSGDASANDGPRILVRVSGPVVDETGVGPGFSGSPIYCRDTAGTARNAGAISESIGAYGGRTVLATPIEEILANPVEAPRPKPIGARTSRIGRVLPLAEPLTVSGLSRGLANKLTEAGAKARRTVLAAPALPLAPFPAAPPRPGSSLSVGYSSGDIAVGAVGTVAYVDGDRVWGFGHPFENSGLRSLLLQDAYVYDVISNPNVGEDSGSTYKLAAAGHTLGTISNDASAAVVGRAGPPPATVPVRIFTEDEDTGARSTIGARVTDETDVGTPTGSSALTFVAPLALAQGASAILRSAPGQLSGTVCVQITLRERKRPLRFCNRYTSAVAPSDTEAGENIVAAGAASDALTALSELDDFKQRRLHVTEFAARVKLRRGLRQAFIRSVTVPRRVRRGQRVRVRLNLQVVRGPRITRSFRLRIPGSVRSGRRRLAFTGHDVDDPESDLFGALLETITIGGDEEDDGAGDPGARSIEAVARRVRDVARYDGVTVRLGGRRVRAYRDADLRISGRGAATVRVRR
ncbi:MAG TPA: hypothetical protein VD836_02775 [Solirubrobacteraceae bacterium]|nr:hypothetical protein [Solirubrobacteraceae bacterium]